MGNGRLVNWTKVKKMLKLANEIKDNGYQITFYDKKVSGERQIIFNGGTGGILQNGTHHLNNSSATNYTNFGGLSRLQELKNKIASIRVEKSESTDKVIDYLAGILITIMEIKSLESGEHLNQEIVEFEKLLKAE